MNREQILAKMAELLRPARAIADAAAKAGRGLTADEQKTITDAVAAAEPLKAQLAAIDSDNATRKGLSDLEDGLGIDLSGAGGADFAQLEESGLLVPSAKHSAGHLFYNSASYKTMLSRAPGGRFGEKMRVGSDPVGFKTLITGASDTSGGALVTNDYLGLQVGLGAFQRPLTVLDIVTRGTTDGDTVEYVRVTGTTNNAAPVPESTTTADPGAMTTANGVKPESALALVKVTETVKTIAHWLPATKRALADAGQVRTLIDQFLRYGLQEELEDQIVSGDGTGENFTGIANVAGTQSQAWSSDILETTRKARTLVRTVGRSVPTAYVMNPADWETIDLLQDNEARYFFGGPSRLGQPTLWGLPVVESEAVPAGTAYVADWRKAVLWNRQQASITVSDSHANFFIRNLVAFLGEERAAFGILQPNAFVEIDMAA